MCDIYEYIYALYIYIKNVFKKAAAVILIYGGKVKINIALQS